MPVADAYAVDGTDGGRLVVGRIEIGYDRLLVGYGNVEPAQAVDGRYKILQCRYVGQFVQIIACVADTLGGEFFFEITLRERMSERSPYKPEASHVRSAVCSVSALVSVGLSAGTTIRLWAGWASDSLPLSPMI